MFLAPCTLPIIPGYLVFIAGNPSRKEERSHTRRRVLVNALAFVVGFSFVFILFGIFAAALGGLLGQWRGDIARLAGAVIILFGLTMLGLVRVPGMRGEWRLALPRFLTLGRPESSLLIGALFALGWSPCIGPILGTVLLFASNSATVLQGALLLGIFSLGLGVPFLLTALLIDSAGSLFARWGKALTALSVLGGILLIVIGVLILSGELAVATQWSNWLFERLGYDKFYKYL
jgi:cytochrome c-type biogenesis protein